MGKTISIEALPDEILIKIFGYLRWDALWRVQLANKRFNTIVSESSKLLEIVRFNYPRYRYVNNPSNVANLTREYLKINPTDRKYSRFNLVQCRTKDIEDFIKTFEYCHLNIREFQMHFFYPVKLSMVAKLLRCCENLQKLKIIGSLMLKPVERDDDTTKMEVGKLDDVIRPTLKLNYLYIDDYDNLELFEECTVEHLCFANRKAGILKLLQFLKTQKKLETLEAEYFTSFDGLIDDEVTFKLKTLILRNVQCEDASNLREFLKVHQTTLRNVIIHGSVSSSLISALSDHPRLNLKLHLSAAIEITDDLPAMRNVASLEIICDSGSGLKFDYEAFDGIFSNLKKLRLANIRNLKPLQSFDSLEELSIKNSVLRGVLVIPRVKKLEFINTTFQMIPNPFDFGNNQIEELLLEYSYFNAWFFSFLQHRDTKLNLLTFRPFTSHDYKIGVINENRHKIKVLRISLNSSSYD